MKMKNYHAKVKYIIQRFFETFVIFCHFTQITHLCAEVVWCWCQTVSTEVYENDGRMLSTQSMTVQGLTSDDSDEHREVPRVMNDDLATTLLSLLLLFLHFIVVFHGHWSCSHFFRPSEWCKYVCERTTLTRWLNSLLSICSYTHIRIRQIAVSFSIWSYTRQHRIYIYSLLHSCLIKK